MTDTDDHQRKDIEAILTAQQEALKEALKAQEDALKASWHPDVVVKRAVSQMRQALWVRAHGDPTASPAAWHGTEAGGDPRDEEIIRLKRELKRITVAEELLREKVAHLEARLIAGTQKRERPE